MKYENKLVIAGARVLWDSYNIRVEELPGKGKGRQLRRYDIETSYAVTNLRRDAFLCQNLMQDAGITAESDYADAVRRLQKATDAAQEETKVQDFAWSRREWKIYFLDVQPEGYDPVEVVCGDFVLTAKWGAFSAYSPSSDFHQADPHYTQIAQTSKAAARKLYKLLRDEAVRARFVKASWGEFPELLRELKVGFEYHHSQWT